MYKHLLTIILVVLLACMPFFCACAEGTRIEPGMAVPGYVTWLLEIASNEVGYTEGAHGRSKYGEWAGDPYAQWCAEFLCWCVDQVDQQHGTQLLRNVYPLYSGQNGGKKWFIQQGRYIARNGYLDDWGYQWLKGSDTFLTTGDYIPQPGDWVFFTWDSDTDTDHVAMVEYCTREEDGSVLIHVIEGNNPSGVARNTYPLTYVRILGYGTVHDCADWTMRRGNSGAKVLRLQQDLVKIGFLQPEQADGQFGIITVNAVNAFQQARGLKVNGIANIETQNRLNYEIDRIAFEDPDAWHIVDDDEEDEE